MILPYKGSSPGGASDRSDPQSVKVVKRTVSCINRLKTIRPKFAFVSGSELKQTPVTSSPNLFERLRNGETIQAGDPEAYKMRAASDETRKLLVAMNNASDPEAIRDLLSQITGTEIDESVAVFTPLYINYGKHTRIGKNVFINFGCTFLGLGGITIDDNVLIAPNVSLLSEGHPISPEERQSLVPKPIHIKSNAWIGAGATILPGVTVGRNAIVAAGAIVSKDVPDNVIVGGIPAKIIKTIR